MQVGRVGRPHGLDGSFVVEGASENAAHFATGAELWVDGEPARVVGRRRGGGGRPVIRLDRPAARGRALCVPRSALPEPEPDAYYVFQLVGLRVEEQGGRALGRVRDVVAAPANDVLELEGGLSLPLVGACVLEIDLESGRIVVAEGFAEPL